MELAQAAVLMVQEGVVVVTDIVVVRLTMLAAPQGHTGLQVGPRQVVPEL